eukprot:6200395-Pleurochrysis_carterae.AAC.3
MARWRGGVLLIDSAVHRTILAGYQHVLKFPLPPFITRKSFISNIYVPAAVYISDVDILPYIILVVGSFDASAADDPGTAPAFVRKTGKPVHHSAADATALSLRQRHTLNAPAAERCVPTHSSRRTIVDLRVMGPMSATAQVKPECNQIEGCMLLIMVAAIHGVLSRTLAGVAGEHRRLSENHGSTGKELTAMRQLEFSPYE